MGVPAGSGPPPGRTLQYFRLREELSEDGEQLLSDLSCVQRVFMERLSSADLSEFMEDLVGADTAPDTAWVNKYFFYCLFHRSMIISILWWEGKIV